MRCKRGGLSRFSLMLREQLLDILLQSLSMVKQVCDSTAKQMLLAPQHPRSGAQVHMYRVPVTLHRHVPQHGLVQG